MNTLSSLTSFVHNLPTISDDFVLVGLSSTVPTVDPSGLYPLTNTGVAMYNSAQRGWVFNCSNAYLKVVNLKTAAKFTRCIWAYSTSISNNNAFSSASVPLWYNSGVYMNIACGATIADTVSRGVNSWVHYAATYDGSTLRFYVNGTQQASAASTFSGDTSEHDIGAYSGSNRWNGYLDDARQYSRALSAAEISTIYSLVK
jgi:hypothetical protein